MLYLHGAAKSTAPYVIWTNLQTPWPANTTPSAVGTVASNPDLLFVAGRLLNQAAGVGDVQWRHQRK